MHGQMISVYYWFVSLVRDIILGTQWTSKCYFFFFWIVLTETVHIEIALFLPVVK